MKWKSDPVIWERNRKAFLIFPRSFWNREDKRREWRWLEVAEWKEKKNISPASGDESWEMVGWLDR